MRIEAKFAKILAGAVLTIGAFVGQGLACSCPDEPDTKSNTLWQRDRADFVFTAKALLVEPFDRSSPRLRSIKLKVEGVWKGDLLPDVEMRTDDMPGLGCEPVLTQGKSHLIFARKVGDYLKVLDCSYTMPLSRNRVAGIISFLGPSKAPKNPQR